MWDDIVEYKIIKLVLNFPFLVRKDVIAERERSNVLHVKGVNIACLQINCAIKVIRGLEVFRNYNDTDCRYQPEVGTNFTTLGIGLNFNTKMS